MHGSCSQIADHPTLPYQNLRLWASGGRCLAMKRRRSRKVKECHSETLVASAAGCKCTARSSKKHLLRTKARRGAPQVNMGRYSLTQDQTRYLLSTSNVKRLLEKTFRRKFDERDITVRSNQTNSPRATLQGLISGLTEHQEKNGRWLYNAERALTVEEVE